MHEQLYHCRDCDFEWYYPHPNGRYCANCSSKNIYRYPRPKFQPQQWVKYKPFGALYHSRTAQIAEVRPDEQGGWVYLLPKNPPNTTILVEFPENALETEEN